MSKFNDRVLSQLNHVGIAIRRGITLLAAHPSVDEVIKIYKDENTHCVEATIRIRLGFPNQWLAEGSSPNGVFSVESVTFSFSPNFPTNAPIVKLRDDFDRSLAHVQPGSLEGPVLPCLYEGDLNELLLNQGLGAILDQAVSWLEKAAFDSLIDPNQGWEPVRRDTLEDFIIADSNYLRSLVTQKKGHIFLPFFYIKLEKQRSSDRCTKEYFIDGQVHSHPLKFKDFEQLFLEEATRFPSGRSLALVVLPDKLPSVEPHVVARYLPETVTDFVSLRKRAKESGCGRNFEIALSFLKQKIASLDSSGTTFPIAIILCVRRPFHLIGENSEIEILPYLLEIELPRLLPNSGSTRVFPAGHKYAITPQLLRTFSGEKLSEIRDVVLVGCGSLGSKIALHMARSGVAPSAVIDKSFLSPHNATRHALIPDFRELELMWGISKAKALSLAIKGLKQSTKSSIEDVTTVAPNSNLFKKLFPKDTWAIINSTASLAVRETLASIPSNKLYPRVIETTLFADGAVGLMTVEGPKRNPNCVDLITEAYELMRQDSQLRQVVFEAEDPIRHCSTGQGCGSTTMIIPDAQISLLAAAMTQGISHMRATGLPALHGQVRLGTVAADGMGLSWTSIDVPPVQIVPVDSFPSWTVRLCDRAHQRILEECAQYPFVETGGILVGRIFESQQAFIVTDVLPAPSDSYRSEFEFVLGTLKVGEMLEQYSTSCHYTLYCLGTWHSHLNLSGPSERDLQTAKQITSSRSAPFVLLIRTPESYHAVSATNFYAS